MRNAAGKSFAARLRFGYVAIIWELSIPLVMPFSLAVILLALVFSGSALAETGSETYKTRCAPCHGAHGAGDTMIGKNLKIRALGSEDVQKQSDDEFFTIISKGKQRMPAFDRKLSRDEIVDLVKYIRLLKK
jgi:cytochrome c6